MPMPCKKKKKNATKIKSSLAIFKKQSCELKFGTDSTPVIEVVNAIW